MMNPNSEAEGAEAPPSSSTHKSPVTPPPSSDVDLAEGIFNFNRPKDIRDGLGNGVANLLKGQSLLSFIKES